MPFYVISININMWGAIRFECSMQLVFHAVLERCFVKFQDVIKPCYDLCGILINCSDSFCCLMNCCCCFACLFDWFQKVRTFVCKLVRSCNLVHCPFKIKLKIWHNLKQYCEMIWNMFDIAEEYNLKCCNLLFTRGSWTLITNPALNVLREDQIICFPVLMV